ncbi:NAD-dependent epimerase/dehydratase family protein [Actinomadura madurae]|uniref:NAD-dependent epimerase/dehydratase domain-containing protein n=1 Tax=Actinomadura madurae TaxID=1993 RepID=A0A1I5PAV5_9ACTN|nr:NAD-dependent epimerase/dehydratase family protein [Actinomadura madurae]SFP31242.1 hypothetical protein SAMN04489713_11369 [Actinomadura madurae]SPT63864.1 Saccharopine dehydrogenase [Actinomadura madurae]
MIGVLGATGAVGRAAVPGLAGLGLPLRCAARRPPVPGDGTWAVDLRDPARLAEFCAGCRVVVNCAGPSYEVLDTVARAALDAGADYVDPAGDDPLHALLAPRDLASRGRRAVLSAGLLPGLSGLLPRMLAGHGQATGLLAFAGGLAPLTPAAARDFLLSASAGIGEPLAGWSGGRRAPRSLRPVRDVRLPFLPGEATAYPYLPTEIERAAALLGVREARWYNVFPTGRAERVLSALWNGGVPDLDEAAARLMEAIRLDLAGRDPYHRIVVQASGPAGTRTLVVASTDGYEPAAAVTVAATAAVLGGTVPAGTHYAAGVLEPSEVHALLGGLPGVTLTEAGPELHLIDVERAGAGRTVEEGDL